MTLRGPILTGIAGVFLAFSGLTSDMNVFEAIALFVGLGCFVEGWQD